jgi:hypothetical protein
MIQNAVFIRLIEMAIGVFSIYLGYRLFCDAQRRIFINITSGTLLALFGLGMLLTAATQKPRTITTRTSRSANSLKSPAKHGRHLTAV